MTQDELRRQMLLGNVANNLRSFGRGEATTSPAEVMLKLEKYQRAKEIQGRQDTQWNQSQEDRKVTLDQLRKTIADKDRLRNMTAQRDATMSTLGQSAEGPPMPGQVMPENISAGSVRQELLRNNDFAGAKLLKDSMPSAEDYDFKNKGVGIIQQLAPKIQDGTASDGQRRAYALAVQTYTQPRVINDPISGQQTMISPSLPPGFPTVGAATSQPVPRGPQPQQSAKQEQPSQQNNVSTGEISIKPINDITALSKKELMDYRTTAKSVELMKQEMQNLMADISENGVRTIDPTTIMERSTKYNNILMRYKEILNLGVLNGPDLDIMQAILKNPNAPISMMAGDKAVKSSFDTVMKSLDRELKYMTDRGLIDPVSQIEQPPIPNAKKAPDGKWYVKTGDSWYEVQK